ncbi:hypothetical protein PPERSA_06969 [Pseudocohnilembus persalinus]|uniref:Uncharacterized protein n=1 Tax=Pseudocohnilembus persalinus TaxID=266149 RepID=A0A0V0QZ63_PSEPJ|nr:hypothetical protein PPERSA_06969 [Pseudocohnilembus persalinus]|eukprot:KRX07354.1 hypothetical protein PPERSA_06969 [Pseudocohnilembus persalinus]
MEIQKQPDLIQFQNKQEQDKPKQSQLNQEQQEQQEEYLYRLNIQKYVMQYQKDHIQILEQLNQTIKKGEYDEALTILQKMMSEKIMFKVNSIRQNNKETINYKDTNKIQQDELKKYQKIQEQIQNKDNLDTEKKLKAAQDNYLQNLKKKREQKQEEKLQAQRKEENEKQSQQMQTSAQQQEQNQQQISQQQQSQQIQQEEEENHQDHQETNSKTSENKEEKKKDSMDQKQVVSDNKSDQDSYQAEKMNTQAIQKNHSNKKNTPSKKNSNIADEQFPPQNDSDNISDISSESSYDTEKPPEQNNQKYINEKDENFNNNQEKALSKDQLQNQQNNQNYNNNYQQQQQQTQQQKHIQPLNNDNKNIQNVQLDNQIQIPNQQQQQVYNQHSYNNNQQFPQQQYQNFNNNSQNQQQQYYTHMNQNNNNGQYNQQTNNFQYNYQQGNQQFNQNMPQQFAYHQQTPQYQQMQFQNNPQQQYYAPQQLQQQQQYQQQGNGLENYINGEEYKQHASQCNIRLDNQRRIQSDRNIKSQIYDQNQSLTYNCRDIGDQKQQNKQERSQAEISDFFNKSIEKLGIDLQGFFKQMDTNLQIEIQEEKKKYEEKINQIKQKYYQNIQEQLITQKERIFIQIKNLLKDEKHEQQGKNLNIKDIQEQIDQYFQRIYLQNEQKNNFIHKNYDIQEKKMGDKQQIEQNLQKQENEKQNQFGQVQEKVQINQVQENLLLAKNIGQKNQQGQNRDQMLNKRYQCINNQDQLSQIDISAASGTTTIKDGELNQQQNKQQVYQNQMINLNDKKLTQTQNFFTKNLDNKNIQNIHNEGQNSFQVSNQLQQLNLNGILKEQEKNLSDLKHKKNYSLTARNMEQNQSRNIKSQLNDFLQHEGNLKFINNNKFSFSKQNLTSVLNKEKSKISFYNQQNSNKEILNYDYFQKKIKDGALKVNQENFKKRGHIKTNSAFCNLGSQYIAYKKQNLNQSEGKTSSEKSQTDKNEEIDNFCDNSPVQKEKKKGISLRIDELKDKIQNNNLNIGEKQQFQGKIISNQYKKNQTKNEKNNYKENKRDETMEKVSNFSIEQDNFKVNNKQNENYNSKNIQNQERLFGENLQINENQQLKGQREKNIDIAIQLKQSPISKNQYEYLKLGLSKQKDYFSCQNSLEKKNEQSKILSQITKNKINLSKLKIDENFSQRDIQDLNSQDNDEYGIQMNRILSQKNENCQKKQKIQDFFISNGLNNKENKQSKMIKKGQNNSQSSKQTSKQLKNQSSNTSDFVSFNQDVFSILK